MPDNKIACIIPVKNRRNMVSEAIESALAQGRMPDEVIVVDDGSTDGTGELVQKRFPMVKFLKGRNLGPGGARNLGAMAAEAEILMFLDSDDFWTDDHVEKLIKAMDGKKACSFGITLNQGQCLEAAFTIPGQEFQRHRPMEWNLFRWCSLVPSSVAIRKEAFLRTGGFPNAPLGEDWLFFARLSLDYEFGFEPTVVTVRKIHSGNLCWKVFSQELAITVVDRLTEMASNAGKCEYLTHLNETRNLILDKGDQWKNVQEWYRALIKYRLL